ncbi:hypothetical protein C2S42_04255 [Helicobacter pylori]|uniref:hypothetical protein n=1 Tax=Helicobacter pylori TaxID=210 RepID=UPI000D3C8639|nr:hypothetical protein [Helicobacter pylori]PUB92926.1 hypothetical protein C2S42_04255 [Helicobacter pylori]
METKFFYNKETGRYHSKLTGKRLHGCAGSNARVKHRYGSIKNLEQGALSFAHLAQAKSEECEYWKKVAQTLLPNLGV